MVLVAAFRLVSSFSLELLNIAGEQGITYGAIRHQWGGDVIMPLSRNEDGGVLRCRVARSQRNVRRVEPCSSMSL